nr:TerB N-terminal domain-containing protein [uncultured Albidiferax sp.]
MLFSSASKQPTSATPSRAKTTTATKTLEASARATSRTETVQVSESSSLPAPVVATSRFVPDDHPVSLAQKAPLSTAAVPSHPAPPTGPRRFVDDDAPVSVVAKEPSKPAHYAIPPAPTQPQTYTGPGRWIPPGEDVVIGGSHISGGMIYVGRDLKALSGSTDPCLINPALSVAAHANISEREFGYWPSYSEITPRARRAYLSWLAEGRRDPEADIGYVFLFFYGLERRAIAEGLKDAQAQKDWPLIAQEVRRLLEIYGEKSFSFKRYASELLSWLEVSHYSKTLYNEPVPSFPTTFEVPLYIRLALGLAAVDGVPVPPHLALAWARLDPASYLRTSATRCAEQFDKLFQQRYAETFKPGIVLPRNKTKLKLVYQPASAGFRGVNEIKLTFGDTPDVTVLTAPQKQLKKIVDAVTDQLDPYSRYLGRNPDSPNALEGLLFLPPTVWPDAAGDALKALRDRVSEGFVVMKLQELLDLFQAKTALNKERAVTLAKTLESVGIGMEPDVLGGARTPKGEDHVVLYSAAESNSASVRTAAYQAAALTLQLASAVAGADGEFSEHEMTHLSDQVQSWSHLTDGESARLLAHLRLLAVEPVSLTSLKKKLDPLDAKSKETIATFMATVAQADGTVTPAEVKMLEKVYKTLGLDTKRVFTDVHAVAAGTSPQPSISAQPAAKGFQLDTAKIAALQKDSERVSALLADIFKEESSQPTVIAAVPEAAPPLDAEAAVATGLFGLDEAHSAFARMLLSRPQWTREELLDVSSDLDLMLDGALEHINEVSFDTHDIPFTEGDDPIDVNPEILEKLEA